MATNPNIALSYRPNVALNRRDPLADAANIQSLQSNQFKFDELKRDRDEMMQLQEQLKGMGQDPDLDKLMDVYVRSGRPDYVKMGIEGKQKLKEQREYAKLIGGDMAAAAPAAAPAFGMPAGAQPSGDYTSTQTMGRVPGVVTTPIPDAAPMNALAPAAAPAAAPANALANPNAGQIQQTQKRINDLMQFAASNPGMAGQAMQQAKLLQDQLEMFSRAKPPEAAKLADRFVPVGRLVFDRETQQYISPSQSQLAQSQERPAAGGGTRAAPAAPAPKPMTELQQQASRKVMAADKTSVKNSQSVVGELEKLTDELVGNPEKGIRPDPGLGGITGFQALIPSLPKSDARKAQQKLETMKGKVMAFGRQLASLEGKLGNMAVQEWKFVSDSIQALDPAAGNLDVQLRDIVRQAKNFANTVQERYDMTYEGAESTAAPSGAGGNAPAAGGLSAAEQAELDQLRKRFGK
jgi:hypothetical protein